MPEVEKREGKTVHRQKHPECEGQEGLSVNKRGNPEEARPLAALPQLGVQQILAWTRTSAFMPRHDPEAASSEGAETASRCWQVWCRADKNQALKSALEPSEAQKTQ